MTLRLVEGGRAPERIGAIDVVIEREGESSSPVDARVLEEDRFLTLSAVPRVELLSEPNRLRTLTRGFAAEPAELGTLVLQQGRPLTLLAVVVDVDAEPQVEEAHVRRALERVLAVCVAQRCVRVRVPLLGRRGGLLAERCAALLREVLAAHRGDHPRQVIIAAREGEKF